jgi:hypothetical protein
MEPRWVAEIRPLRQPAHKLPEITGFKPTRNMNFPDRRGYWCPYAI